MIFGMFNPEKIWHENLTDCPPRLSDVAIVLWEIQKSHFQQYYSYILLIIYVLTRIQTAIHLPTPHENVTILTCESQNIHPLTPILITRHPLSTSSIYYDP